MLDDYTLHQKELYKYISKLLSSYGYAHEDAEDVLQETYCRVLRRAQEGANHPNPKAYMFVIARNIVTDLGRRKTVRHEKHHVPIDDVCLPDNEGDAEAYAILGQLESRYSDSLKSLNPKDREVFIMHKYMLLTQSNIATILGISTRAVERRMSSAVKHLTKQLREFL